MFGANLAKSYKGLSSLFFFIIPINLSQYSISIAPENVRKPLFSKWVNVIKAFEIVMSSFVNKTSAYSLQEKLCQMPVINREWRSGL